ncbi:hypothetical protein GCM10009715_41660 [Paeniglutamicibacter psychrophenolicus]
MVGPGIQLEWDKIPGWESALATSTVSSNYRFDLAPKTWDMIRSLRSGTAVFTMPSAPIKCGGAPQKIAYLAADYCRQQGVLNDIRVGLVLPTPGMFGVKAFADELEKAVARYGIEVRKSSEMTRVDGATKTITVGLCCRDQRRNPLRPAACRSPQPAPDCIKNTMLADPKNPLGYVQVDKHTHCNTPAIPTSSLWGMQGQARTPKPGQPSAKRLRFLSITCCP